MSRMKRSGTKKSARVRPVDRALRGDKFEWTDEVTGVTFHRERMETGYVDDGVWATYDERGERAAVITRIGSGWQLRVYSPDDASAVDVVGVFFTLHEAAYWGGEKVLTIRRRSMLAAA